MQIELRAWVEIGDVQRGQRRASHEGSYRSMSPHGHKYRILGERCSHSSSVVVGCAWKYGSRLAHYDVKEDKQVIGRLCNPNGCDKQTFSGPMASPPGHQMEVITARCRRKKEVLHSMRNIGTRGGVECGIRQRST